MNRRSRICIGVSFISIGAFVIIGIFIYLFVFAEVGEGRPNKPIWPKTCENICGKLDLSGDSDNSIGSNICQLSCGQGIETLWPLPKSVKFERDLVAINIRNVEYKVNPIIDKKHWLETFERFEKHIKLQLPKSSQVKNGGKNLTIDIAIAEANLSKVSSLENELLKI
jgi:hypothetical protein